MLPVVTERSRPTSAMAWLLIIFFEPFIGVFLYILFAEGRLPRKRIRRHERVKNIVADSTERFADSETMQVISPEDLDSECQTLASCIRHIPILGGNDVQLISKTNNVIDSLVADIDDASRSVHLLFYIFLADDTGQRVMRALARAVERGVTCRLIADAVGSRPFFRHHAESLKKQGVEVHAALPVNLFRRKLARMDLRNHRKLAVIDGKTAYTGSQNIVHANYGHKDLTWYDLTLRVNGPSVVELQSVFVKDWLFETGEILNGESIFVEPKRAGNIQAQILPSGPTDHVDLYRNVVTAAVYAAKKEVVITSPYFVPDGSLMQAIEVAVLRGVDVKVVLPRKVDQLIVGAANRAYYYELLMAGASLYHFTPGLIHAKSMTIDGDIAFVGSANFDIRSFQLNFELNVILYGEEVASRVRDKQQEYIENSEPVLLKEWVRRSSSARFIQNIARLMSPLL